MYSMGNVVNDFEITVYGDKCHLNFGGCFAKFRNTESFCFVLGTNIVLYISFISIKYKIKH